jgi:hypothetical protein
MNDDMYSLYEWLREMELLTISRREQSTDRIDKSYLDGSVMTFKLIMQKIENSDNQRPHIRGKV